MTAEVPLADPGALVALASRPVDTAHRWVSDKLVMTGEPASMAGPPPRYTFEGVAKGASRLGLVYAGTKTEGIQGRKQFRSDIWLDPERRVFLVGREEQGDAIHRSLSRYYLLSFFEDGTCIETVSSRKPISKGGMRLFIRAGREELEADYEAHLTAAAHHALKRNTRALPVRSLDDVLLLMRAYYEHVLPPEVASSLRWQRLHMARALVVVAITLALIVRAIVVWLRPH